MKPPVIRVEGLAKRYLLGTRRAEGTLRESVSRCLVGLFAKRPPMPKSFWALRDVSFTIDEGEVVGIIGRNGAGKSTLLKVLARIIDPTEGWAEIRGRVASLLEVGTGFHADLTGRENVNLSGAILGMSRREIQASFDEIVAFAEVEKFIDMPVKHYSSGMYLRLAFAVAAHLRPEVLLVDEALAVGDASFQRKCLGRMGAVAQSGRTVLFVSHDLGAVATLTSRCCYLDGGTIRELGPTDRVLQRYTADLMPPDVLSRPGLDRYHRKRPDDTPVRICAVWVDTDRTAIPQINIGDSFNICVEIESAIECRGALVALVLRRAGGAQVTSLLSLDQGFALSAKPGRAVITARIVGLPLSPGDYVVTAGVNQADGREAWDVVIDYPLLRVTDGAGKIVFWPSRPQGAVHWSQVTWSLAVGDPVGFGQVLAQR